MKPEGISKFREFIRISRQVLEQNNEASLRHFIEMNGLILFFKKDKDYFGCGEDGRMIFARLKNPDDETPEGWEDEASFSAVNLSRMIKGESSQQVFDNKSLKGMKVVDQEDVINNLKNEAGKKEKNLGGLKIIHVGISRKDRDDAPNFNRTDEE